LSEEYADAEKWSKKLLKYNPDDKMVKAYRAAAKEKDNTAIKDQFELVQKQRETSSLWKHASGNSSKAIAGFRELLKQDQNDVNAMNGLGFMLLNGGKHAEAKPLFEKCIKLRPEHYGAMNGLARCCKDADDTDEAIRIWNECCDKMPQVSAATAGLAMTYFGQKNYKKALPFLKQLVSSDTWSNKHYEAMFAKAEAEQKAK
jgi:tetratricopeptide (TPR) repeat protein